MKGKDFDINKVKKDVDLALYEILNFKWTKEANFVISHYETGIIKNQIRYLTDFLNSGKNETIVQKDLEIYYLAREDTDKLAIYYKGVSRLITEHSYIAHTEVSIYVLIAQTLALMKNDFLKLNLSIETKEVLKIKFESHIKVISRV